MKPSEFYENYWKIDYGNGKLVSPPKLSEKEEDFLDNNAVREDCAGVLFMRKRGRNVEINIEALKSQLSKLPKFFISKNQPILDKFGNVIEEQKKLPPKMAFQKNQITK